MLGLRIFPALRGGFVVIEDSDPGRLQQVQFAGTLDECLEFLREWYTKPAEGKK